MAEQKGRATTKGPESVGGAETKDELTALRTENAQLQKALAARAGLDSSLSEVYQNKTYSWVQFLRAYNAAGKPSEIDPKKMLVDSYSAEKGDVVLLLDSEVERLKDAVAHDGEPILTTDSGAFKPKQVYARRWNAKLSKPETVLDHEVKVEDMKKAERRFG